MITKQTIAILGATEKTGSVISKSLAKGNYRILLQCDVKKEAADLIREIRQDHPSADVEYLDCAVNAGWEADIIIPAIPYERQREMLEKIREVANQKTVISIVDPMNEKTGISEAEELQSLLPNSKVMIAFII